MANHKSAIKRAKQNVGRRERNRIRKTKIKNAVKKVQTAASDNAETVHETLNTAKSVISKAAKTGVIHKNTASRKISRLETMVNKLNAD